MAAVEPAGRIGLGRRGLVRRRLRWRRAAASPCGAGAFCLSHPASAEAEGEAGERGDHEPQGSGLQRDVGRALRRRALGAHARDKCLDRASTSGCGGRTSPASRAHVAMLGASGIVSQEDADAIEEGLDRIADEYEADGVPEDVALEDIHMHVEHRLAELIGPAAGRLHTARSRNDQVATDFQALGARRDRRRRWPDSRRCSARWSTRAGEHAAIVMPGFTHLQAAQPVTLGHHLMAYYEMLRARPLALRRRAGAAQRMPARHRRRWPAPAFRSTARRPRSRSASTGRPPIRSTRSRTATSRSII